MKKFLSILMCMVLVLGCISTAIAANSPVANQPEAVSNATTSDGTKVTTVSVTTAGIKAIAADGTVTTLAAAPALADATEPVVQITSALAAGTANGLSEEANKALAAVAANADKIATEFKDTAKSAIQAKADVVAQALEANIATLTANVSYYESKGETAKAEEAKKALAEEQAKLDKVKDASYIDLSAYTVVLIADVSASQALSGKNITVDLQVPGVDASSDVIALDFHSNAADVALLDSPEAMKHFDATYVAKSTVAKDVVTVELGPLSPVAVLVRAEAVVPGTFSAAAPTGVNNFVWVYAVLAVMAMAVAGVVVARKKNN